MKKTRRELCCEDKIKYSQSESPNHKQLYNG